MTTNDNIHALIVDDHSLYRSGLGLLLQDRLGIERISEAKEFDEALDKLANSPDIAIALFDLSMPGMGGPTCLGVVKETYPNLRVAVISGSEDRDNVIKTISTGLNGYIPKSLSEDEIADALKLILAGNVFVPKFMTDSGAALATSPKAKVATDAEPGAVTPPKAAPPPAHDEELTPRQRDVLACVVRGLSNKEVARELGIAEGTVKIHLAALFGHFGVRNRTELAIKAHAGERT